MVAQKVVVSGVDDFVHDLDVAYTVTIAPDAGSDEKYLGLKEELSFVNLDDDVVGVYTKVQKNITSEGGDVGEGGEYRDAPVDFADDPFQPRPTGIVWRAGSVVNVSWYQLRATSDRHRDPDLTGIFVRLASLAC